MCLTGCACLALMHVATSMLEISGLPGACDRLLHTWLWCMLPHHMLEILGLPGACDRLLHI